MKADVITVEGKEWSASNASEAEEILPKCAKEKIKYSGLSLTNHHPFNMLELRLISKGWLDFSLLLVPFQMPHRGSANPLRSSSLCPRGAISRIPGCLHRTNPGTSREKPGPHFAWLKDTQSHSISLPQCGPTGRSWFKAVQIRMQLSTPQTCTVGRQNMHMGVWWGLVGRDRQRRRPKLHRSGPERGTETGIAQKLIAQGWPPHLIPSCCHMASNAIGINDFKATHLEVLMLFLDTAYRDSFPFLIFPETASSHRSDQWPHWDPHAMWCHTEGRPWLHLMCWLTFIPSQWPSFLCSIFFLPEPH